MESTAKPVAAPAKEQPDEKVFRVAVTGHRPGDLRAAGVNATHAGRRMVAAAIAAAERRACSLEMRTGGALGIDQSAAAATLEARAEGKPVRLVVCLPLPAAVMTERWPATDRARLEAQLAAADEIVGPEFESFTFAAYPKRNRRLLERADVLLATWTGKQAGGTADALRAATIELGVPTYLEQESFRRLSPVEVAPRGRLTRLPANAIFVFGSNTAGRHGAGAARDAALRFGAAAGVAEGISGQSYALPTVHWRGGPAGPVSAKELRAALGRLSECALSRPDLAFVMTDVGAGLAGMSEADLASAFVGLQLAANVLPTPRQRAWLRG